jgi:hypothetical protein
MLETIYIHQIILPLCYSVTTIYKQKVGNNFETEEKVNVLFSF